MLAITSTLTKGLATAASPATLGEPLGDLVVVFAVSLLVGGLAIHVATSHLVGAGDYGDALLTALLGAIAWAVLDVVPFVGPLLALVAWVGIIAVTARIPAPSGVGGSAPLRETTHRLRQD
jgi:hypothetical protein